MKQSLHEIGYHLSMVRARLHTVPDKVARESLDRRLTSMEAFVSYLVEESDRPWVQEVTI